MSSTLQPRELDYRMYVPAALIGIGFGAILFTAGKTNQAARTYVPPPPPPIPGKDNDDGPKACHSADPNSKPQTKATPPSTYHTILYTEIGMVAFVAFIMLISNMPKRTRSMDSRGSIDLELQPMGEHATGAS